MNYLIIFPFKVPGDSLVEYDLNFPQKICSTFDELYTQVSIAKDKDNIILSYIPLTQWDLDSSWNVIVVDFKGNFVEVNDNNIAYALSHICEDAKSILKIGITPIDDKISHPILNTKLRHHLALVAYNYLLGKIDIHALDENDAPIRTYLDALRYLVKRKFAFLEDIPVVTQVCTEKTLYEQFCKILHGKSFYEVEKKYVYKGYDIDYIKDVLDSIVLDEKDLSDNKILLKECTAINNVWFHSEKGYMINISNTGEVSIKHSDYKVVFDENTRYMFLE